MKDNYTLTVCASAQSAEIAATIENFFFCHPIADLIKSLNSGLNAFTQGEPEHCQLESAVHHTTGTIEFLLELKEKCSQ